MMPQMRCHPSAPFTLPDGVDNIVVVAPHPDDESLSTGVLLAHTAMHAVPTTVIAVTDGESAYDDAADPDLGERRVSEQLAALAQLGHPADRVVRLGLPDGALSHVEGQLAKSIAERLNSSSLLVAPSAHDWHPDHEACGRAATTAAAAHAGCRHWSSLFWALHHPERLMASRPRLVRVPATADQLHRRRQAVACHHTQLSREAGEPVLRAQLLAHLDEPGEWYVDES